MLLFSVAFSLVVALKYNPAISGLALDPSVASVVDNQLDGLSFYRKNAKTGKVEVVYRDLATKSEHVVLEDTEPLPILRVMKRPIEKRHLFVTAQAAVDGNVVKISKDSSQFMVSSKKIKVEVPIGGEIKDIRLGDERVAVAFHNTQKDAPDVHFSQTDDLFGKNSDKRVILDSFTSAFAGCRDCAFDRRLIFGLCHCVPGSGHGEGVRMIYAQKFFADTSSVLSTTATAWTVSEGASYAALLEPQSCASRRKDFKPDARAANYIRRFTFDVELRDLGASEKAPMPVFTGAKALVAVFNSGRKAIVARKNSDGFVELAAVELNGKEEVLLTLAVNPDDALVHSISGTTVAVKSHNGALGKKEVSAWVL